MDLSKFSNNTKTVTDVAIKIQTEAASKWLVKNGKGCDDFNYYYDYFAKMGCFVDGIALADMVIKKFICEDSAIDYLVGALNLYATAATGSGVPRVGVRRA